MEANMTPRMSTRSSRFWERVTLPDGCWLWTGQRNENGYGVLNHILAHRLAWEVFYGPIPPGLKVCHHCDNPPCVRPDHLFLGTQRANVLDAESKGRMPHHGPRGIAAPSAKLTDEKVLEMRMLHNQGVKGRALAVMFGVTAANVSHVLLRHTWTHI